MLGYKGIAPTFMCGYIMVRYKGTAPSRTKGYHKRSFRVIPLLNSSNLMNFISKALVYSNRKSLYLKLSQPYFKTEETDKGFPIIYLFLTRPIMHPSLLVDSDAHHFLNEPRFTLFFLTYLY